MSDYFNATGTIGFTCDVCGRELQGCTWVNGMRFCAKCYQETFGNTNPFEKELRDKIADLEAKLAENIVLLEGLRKSEEEKKDIAMKRVYELKQQLAEKEKEIERLNYKLEEIDNNFIDGQQADQAKTDFAIAQLEKVKELLNDCYGYEYTSHYHFIQSKAEEKIDQQINELKEGK